MGSALTKDSVTPTNVAWLLSNGNSAVMRESADRKGWVIYEDSGPYGVSTTFMAKRYGDRPLIPSFDAAVFWAEGVLNRLWGKVPTGLINY